MLSPTPTTSLFFNCIITVPLFQTAKDPGDDPGHLLCINEETGTEKEKTLLKITQQVISRAGLKARPATADKAG